VLAVRKTVIRPRVPQAIAAVLALLSVACDSSGGGLSRPRSERRIDCPTAGSPLKYTGKFTPGEARSPADNLYITFVERRPTSDEAAAVLQHCINTTVRTFRVDYELLATAWFNQEGPLPLPDGSATLNYDPKTGVTRSWSHRAASKPVEAAQRPGYSIEVQKHQTPVPPHGSVVTIDVVFERPPDAQAIMDVLVGEIRRAVGTQTPKVNTVAYPRMGPTGPQNQRPQIRGASGAFLSAHFDAKTGEIRDQDRNVIGSIR
jgi:hypothetical protein